jgi:hypothetical protein
MVSPNALKYGGLHRAQQPVAVHGVTNPGNVIYFLNHGRTTMRSLFLVVLFCFYLSAQEFRATVAGRITDSAGGAVSAAFPGRTLSLPFWQIGSNSWQ